MPVLLARLGPVKAFSYRVARRIANTLRAGSAVHDYAPFESCDYIWLAVPEDSVAQIERELVGYRSGNSALQGKIVILCGSVQDSLRLVALRASGSRVASVNVMAETEERVFVGEGDPDAVTELRRRLAVENRKLIVLAPGSKPFYWSGVNLSSSLLLPWIAGAVESLRAAGLSRSEATRLAEALGARALRSYAKAGAKSWGPAAAGSLSAVLERDLAVMRQSEPKLTALYAAGVDCARKFFREE